MSAVFPRGCPDLREKGRERERERGVSRELRASLVRSGPANSSLSLVKNKRLFGA